MLTEKPCERQYKLFKDKNTMYNDRLYIYTKRKRQLGYLFAF